jgi:hypothetical protein
MVIPMKLLAKMIWLLPITALTLFNSLGNQAAQATTLFRLSQESTPGAGDFDNNVLGFLSPFQTTGTASDFYAYDSGSFHGPVTLQKDTSHLFLVDASDGLSLFTVHDKPEDGGGGLANMQFDLIGDTASFLFVDDPPQFNFGDGHLENGTSFVLNTAWDACCTDGAVIGSLDNDWTLFGQFTGLGNLAGGGLTGWQALSGEGSVIDLALDIDRRVRIDRIETPEPASSLGLVFLGTVGTMLLRQRRKYSPSTQPVHDA